MLYFFCHWFVKITGYIPQRIMFRTKIRYEDKNVQSRRIRSKAIVVCNHNSLMDVGVLMFVFPTRTLRCAVAELLYRKNIFMTALLCGLGCIRVDRGSFDFSFVGKLKRILDRGGVVEIYPEARLPQKGEQRPLPFKPSYVHLALQADAPIIPVYCNGKIGFHHRTEVVIGKPIDARSMYDGSLSEKENVLLINEYVRSRIVELGKDIEEG